MTSTHTSIKISFFLVFSILLMFNVDGQNISVRSSQVDGDIFHLGGAIGIGTDVPASSSLLDVSSDRKGILIPRLTSQQIAAIENPAHSLFVFNISENMFMFYDANLLQWKAMVSTEGSSNSNLLWNRDGAKNGVTFLSNIGDKVGIGTHNPNASLEIKPKGDNALRILSSDNGTPANIQFADNDDSNYVGFIAPENIEENTLWELPATKGDSGQVLTINEDGKLIWDEKYDGNTWVFNKEQEAIYLANRNYNVGIGTEKPQKQIHLFKNYAEEREYANLRMETYFPQGGTGINRGHNIWDIENNGRNLYFKFGLANGVQDVKMNNILSLNTENNVDGNLVLHGEKITAMQFQAKKDDNLTSFEIINDGGNAIIQYNYENTTKPIINYSPEKDLGLMNNCFVSEGGNVEANQFSVKNDKFLVNAQGNVIAKTYKSNKFDVSTEGVVTAKKFVGDGSELTGIKGTWQSSGGNIYYDAGNVKVGNFSPGYYKFKHRFQVIEEGNINNSLWKEHPFAIIGTSNVMLMGTDETASENGTGYIQSWHFNTKVKNGEKSTLALNPKGGNVGIGTSNPSEILEVKKQGNTFIKLINTDSANGSHMRIGPVSSNGYKETQLQFEGKFGLYDYSDKRWRMRITESGNIKFFESVWVANEVIVQASAPWPDYVFKDDYKLMPIKELKNYIDKNNHLPNMPTAEEVKKEGVKLAQNQTLMLQKIEELTLYIIDLKEENDGLKERIVELENK